MPRITVYVYPEDIIYHFLEERKISIKYKNAVFGENTHVQSPKCIVVELVYEEISEDC